MELKFYVRRKRKNYFKTFFLVQIYQGLMIKIIKLFIFFFIFPVQVMKARVCMCAQNYKTLNVDEIISFMSPQEWQPGRKNFQNCI